MIILKIIVFIWTVYSIYVSLWWFILYGYNRAKDLEKSDLLWMQLIAPYFALLICFLSFEEVITIIKKRRLKRNGNNA